jgi:hypothetical protein
MKFLTLRTGDMVRIDGYRGDGETRYGTVVHIRDTNAEPVRLATALRLGGNIIRGRYIVTMMDDNRHEVRSYYVAHCNSFAVMTWYERAIYRITKWVHRNG